MSTVETSSTVYTMGNLTHELTPNFIDKIGTNAQYSSIDQHATMSVDSPHISSTPPSTPGLDSNHGKETKEDDLLDGDNDSNDNEKDNDFYDYGYNDYDDYLDDDYSETDEDYFFKDFAGTDTNDTTTTTPSTRRPKSKRYSRRHRSQKAMSRFDLQSFARQLHANRLSVLQTRQSRMVLTEEDEQELNKLLARKHSLDDNTSPPPVPSLPSLPMGTLIIPTEISESTKTEQPHQQNTTTTTTTTTTATTTTTSNDNDLTMVMDASQELAGPISPRLSIPSSSSSSDSIKKNSTLLQKSTDPSPSIKISNNASSDDVAPLSPSLSDPSSLASPSHVSPSPSSSSSSSSTSAKNDSKTIKATPLSFATSTSTSFTVKKKPSWITSHLKHSPSKSKLHHQRNDSNPTTSTLPAPRRSMSVDTLRDQARRQQNDSSSWKKKPTDGTKKTNTGDISENESKPADHTKKPKLRLFGSLRQASRSSRTTGEGTFRGLMRNLSTVGQRQQQQPTTDQLDLHVSESAVTAVDTSNSSNSNSNSNNNKSVSSTMSQAAMAVIHHDASVKKERRAKEKATPIAPELSTKIEVEDDMMDDTTEQVTHTATTASGGVRLLTSLLAKARSSRRSQKKLTTTKQTAATTTTDQQQQQEDDDRNDERGSKQERNKVIRRTIIYVKPDALDFMKDGHLPPIPAPKHRPVNRDGDDDEDNDEADFRFSNDLMMDDTASSTIEYATATKLTRQTSRRKRLVENPTDATTPAAAATCSTTASTTHLDNNNKKWRLESVSEFDLGKSSPSSSGKNNNNTELEGLELREMSDGSVVWGIVKKQGNRKSFFATRSTYLDTDDDRPPQQPQDDIEKSVLALMGLGPDSLDHLPPAPAPTPAPPVRKSKRVPPPIPKRSPRRLEQQQQQQQHLDGSNDGTRRLERGLSVEEQLDEMMLSIKQSQF